MSENIIVGGVYPTNHWGDVEVLSAKGSYVQVKFENTGNIQTTRNVFLLDGAVADSVLAATGYMPDSLKEARRDFVALNVGDVLESRNWGLLKVVENLDGRNFVIEFLDTGNRKKVQKHAIISGWVKDSAESYRLSQVKADKLKADLEAEKVRLQKEKEAQKFAKKREAQEYKQSEPERKRLQLEAELVDVVRTDKVGMEFVIIKLHSDYKTVDIRYLDSGNTYESSISKATKSFNEVYDKLHPNFPQIFKLYQKNRSANHYQENRDRRLEQSKQWQKDNPEKAQHRNRHRRALRKGSEGTHTKDEIDALYVSQDGLCNCCGVQLGAEHGQHLDHIMPITLGGGNSIENLQWLCQFCNNSKGGKHPDEWVVFSGTEEFKTRRKSLLTPTL